MTPGCSKLLKVQEWSAQQSPGYKGCSDQTVPQLVLFPTQPYWREKTIKLQTWDFKKWFVQCTNVSTVVKLLSYWVYRICTRTHTHILIHTYLTPLDDKSSCGRWSPEESQKGSLLSAANHVSTRPAMYLQSTLSRARENKGWYSVPDV